VVAVFEWHCHPHRRLDPVPFSATSETSNHFAFGPSNFASQHGTIAGPVIVRSLLVSCQWIDLQTSCAAAMFLRSVNSSMFREDLVDASLVLASLSQKLFVSLILEQFWTRFSFMTDDGAGIISKSNPELRIPGGLDYGIPLVAEQA
jgi:hypothetical protein